jgi:hypothetical protein
MLETLGNDPKGQRLNFSHRLVPVLPVAQHARQGRHFAQPSAISLAFEFDGEDHHSTVYPRSAAQQAVAADGARWHPERGAAVDLLINANEHGLAARGCDNVAGGRER